MIVECSSCKTNFPVDPKKVPTAGIHARCSVCGEVFFVKPPEPDTAWAEPEPTPEVEAMPERGVAEPEADVEAGAEVHPVESADIPPSPEQGEDAEWEDDEGSMVVEGYYEEALEVSEDFTGQPAEGWAEEASEEYAEPQPEAFTGERSEDLLEQPPEDFPGQPQPDMVAEPPEEFPEPEHDEFERFEPVDAADQPGEEPADEEPGEFAEPEPDEFESLEPAGAADQPPGEPDDEPPEDFPEEAHVAVAGEQPDEGWERTPEEGSPSETEVDTQQDSPPAAPVAPPTFGKRDPMEKAQRLARVLVSDIILYNPDRHQDATQSGRVREEFQEEIQKSWTEYVEQVGEEVANSTSYFTDALNEILARGEEVF